MDIVTGRPESHESYLGYDPAQSPGVAPPGVRVPGGSGPADTGQLVGGVAGSIQGDIAAGEADWAAAQAHAVAASSARRNGYEQSLTPVGAMYGDQPVLPVVPEDANAPAADFLFGTGGGDQPGRGA